MKEINLEQILFKHWCEWYKETFGVSEPPGWEGFKEGSNSYFVKAMRDATQQTLELAAENAKVVKKYGDLVLSREDSIEIDPGKAMVTSIQVSKKSIMDTINQVT